MEDIQKNEQSSSFDKTETSDTQADAVERTDNLHIADEDNVDNVKSPTVSNSQTNRKQEKNKLSAPLENQSEEKKTTQKRTTKKSELNSESDKHDSEQEFREIPPENALDENTEELSTLEETLAGDFEEDNTQFSFFSISSAEFDAAYSESPLNITSDEEIQPEENEDEEQIIPPDELFAYRSKPEESDESTVDETFEMNVDSSSMDREQEENIDDDGQYHFTDLETAPSFKNAEKESVLDKYDASKPRNIDRRFDLIELFVFTLLAVMILTTFFFRHSIVEGASMENTLHNGEHLIISDFFYTPRRGDIIVCEDYTTSIKKPIVKRVIAVEGDVITITPDKRVYVNGELLDESDYVYVNGIDLTKPIDNLKVPENELFVMGDHRNDSEDSRSIGTISEDAVLGKVILRFYPFNKFGPVS